MVAFSADQIASLWHRYQHGLIGLTTLTYSSIMSWDEFVEKEEATARKEASWLADRNSDLSSASPSSASLTIQTIHRDESASLGPNLKHCSSGGCVD